MWVAVAWLLDIAAFCGLLFWLRVTWAYRGNYRPRFVEDLAAPADPPPSLTVVLSARNEAASIRACVTSLLDQDYANLDVVAVDDRSTDETGTILDELAATDPRLTVVHVLELPQGWMGKPHALNEGVRRAAGDWVLLTDADVTFGRTCLRRAVAYAESRTLDHLVILPKYILYTAAERAVMTVYGVFFASSLDFGGVENPHSRGHIGIGQFNMIRRRVLAGIGGLAPVRLAVVEDVVLGRVIKHRGYRQAFLCSRADVAFRWQRNIRGIVGVLERNAFAGYGFSVPRVTRRALLIFLANSVAPLALLSPHWWGRAGGAAVVAMIVGAYVIMRPLMGASVWLALCHPITALIFPVGLCLSMIKGVRRGGVTWRGTFYSKEEILSSTDP